MNFQIRVDLNDSFFEQHVHIVGNSVKIGQSNILIQKVRWADVEERQDLEKEKRLGFIVGHTNWDRLRDDNEEELTTRALTKTKFI